jgi:hypothetical protein
VIGLNLIILYLVYFPALSPAPGSDLYYFLMVAAAAYIIFGPIVFVLPMLPFRFAMMDYKDNWMKEIAPRCRTELESLRSKLKTEPPAKADEEIIERFRKIGAMVEEMPVWPFDARTITKFLTAYLVPLASSVVFPMLKTLLGIVSK